MATRRERVVLEADVSQFTTAMAQAAARVAALQRDVDRLDRSRVNIDVDTSGVAAAAAQMAALRAEMERVNRTQLSPSVRSSFTQVTRNANQSSDSINQLTGRLSLLGDTLLAIGPAAVPLAAVDTQAVGGLASAALAAVTAGASAVVAFQGVGDALEAVNEAALEPTTENLQAAQEAMAAIGPDAQQFVRAFQDFRPVLSEIRDAAAAGWFPGLTRSLDDFERLGPLIADLFEKVGAEGGAIVADAAESLDSKRWRPFIRFLGDELPDVMRSLSSTVGDLAHGLAAMWRTLDPTNDGFINFVEDVADGFDRWASSSEGRDDLRSFMEYARENGPAVRDLFLALVDLTAAIVEAAAPLGGPVLESLTAITEAFTRLAESDLASPILAAVAALAVLRRGMALTTAVATRMGTAGVIAAGYNAARGRQPFIGPMTAAQAAAFQQQRRQTMIAGAGGLARTSALVAGLALATSGLAEDTELANTATLGLMGSLAGPYGAALGAAAGYTIDLAAANNEAEESLERFQRAIDANDMAGAREEFKRTREEIDQLREDSEDPSWFQEWAPLSGLAGLTGAVDWWKGREAKGLEARREAMVEQLKVQRQINAMGPVNREALVFNDLFGDVVGQLRVANSLAEDFAGNIGRAFGFLDRRANLVAYEEALDSASEALKENGKNLDANTAKGRANITALDAVAAAGLRMAEDLRGANKQRYLDRLEQDVRRTAQSFGMGGKVLRDYLNDLGLIDRKKVRPELDADDTKLTRKQRAALKRLEQLGNAKANPLADLYTDPFNQAVAGVRNDLRALDGDSATTYVNIVRRETTVRNGEVTANPTRRADGGLITGPGGPREDRIPALLSNGEFVVNAAATARNLSLLQSINARKFADGGPVSSDRLSDLVALSIGRRDADETAKGMKALRRELERTTQTLRDERDRRRELVDGLRGNFTNDPFESSGNVWEKGGGSDPIAGLLGDIGDLRQYRTLIRRLDKRGLDGDALAEADTLAEAQVLAGMTGAELRQYDRLYGQRQRLATQVGGQYATAVTGISPADIRDLQREVREVKRAIRDEGNKGRRNADRNTDRRNSNDSRGAQSAAQRRRKNRD